MLRVLLRSVTVQGRADAQKKIRMRSRDRHRSNDRSGNHELAAPECTLVFGAVFYLDRAVSLAPDDVTSTTTSGASEQKGGFAFTTTHWSLCAGGAGESAAAQEALEKLCRRNIPRQTPSLLKLPLS